MVTSPPLDVACFPNTGTLVLRSALTLVGEPPGSAFTACAESMGNRRLGQQGDGVKIRWADNKVLRTALS